MNVLDSFRFWASKQNRKASSIKLYTSDLIKFYDTAALFKDFLFSGSAQRSDFVQIN